MKYKKICNIAIIVSLCALTRLTFAFELNPTEEQIQKVLSFGSKHFMDIFGTEPIKSARFGNWPNGDGGIVENKLIYLSIISSMRVRSRMPDISQEEIDTIMNSKEMPVRISSSMNVFNVVLKQDGKTIEPSRIEKAMQMPPGGNGPQSFKVYFNYDDFDATSRATIVFFEDFGELEFPIDFSKFN